MPLSAKVSARVICRRPLVRSPQVIASSVLSALTGRMILMEADQAIRRAETAQAVL